MCTQLKAGDKAPNFQFDTPWSSSQDFYETIQHRNAVFVFLRYHGCPICQMEMANLKREIELFNKKESFPFDRNLSFSSDRNLSFSSDRNLSFPSDRSLSFPSDRDVHSYSGLDKIQTLIWMKNHTLDF